MIKMLKTIENLMGFKAEQKKWTPHDLPESMTAGRKFYEANIAGVRFLAVIMCNEDKHDIRSIKKHVNTISDVAECPVVLGLSSIKSAQMEALIRNNISFVVCGEQVYMPFLGMALNYKKTKEKDTVQKFTPAAQMLFLYLIYNKNAGRMQKKDVAEKLHLTRTSITRATELLSSLGLLKEEREGTAIYISASSRGHEYYKMGEKYLISPVQKKIYVRKCDELDKYCVAGESALSERRTNVEMSSYALDKKLLKTAHLEQMDKKWQADYPLAEIECWKYDPMLFAVDGKVDPISLACSFMNENSDKADIEIH